MAGEYNASAKFDSSQAERGINSLAGKIEGLKGKLQGASAAGKQFDSTWAAANRSMTASSAKARSMESSLTRVSRGARTATTSLRGFAGALNTGEMSRAAGIIRSLGTHLSTTSGRMRQIRGHATSLRTSLAVMGRSAVSGALGIERLGKSLAIAIPNMMRGAAAARSLSASLGTLGGVSRVHVAGLNGVAAGHRRVAVGTMASSAAMKKGASSAAQYGHAITGVNGSLLGLGSGLAGVRNLGLAWLTGMGISGLVGLSDTAKLTAARLNLVTDSLGQATAAQGLLMESANRTRTSFRENVNLFAKLAMAGEAYGVSLSKAMTINENVQKSFKISGATTSEAQSASQQLSQAFASGRLQGDELRTILENAPRLQKALSDHLGIPLGEIRKQAKEGLIGIRELVTAFGNAEFTQELNEEFAKIPITIGDAFTMAGNKLLEFVAKVDKAGGLSGKVVDVIKSVANNFELIGVAAAFAGTMIVSSYIPSIINAAKASKAFLALRWAAYGSGVVGSMGAAASGVRLFSGALTRSATSTLPMWKQVVGNVTGAAVLNVQSMGKLFASVFMRLPIIFAIGTAALYAFNDDTKIVEGELATTQDYLVTGFQAAWSAIADIVGRVSSFITDRINATVDNMIWAVDALYRLGKMAGGAVIETGKWTKSLMPGGQTPVEAAQGMTGRITAYGGDGIRADIGKALKGTSWSKAANARAIDRFSDKGSKTPGYQALMLNGGTGMGDGDITGPPPTDDKAGRKNKGKTGKSDAEKAAEAYARELKRVNEAMDRLNGTFSEAEKVRQEFNEGLLTLGQALSMNIIDVTQFDDKLRRLAHEAFPGLRDEMEGLQQENKDLIIKARGGSDMDVDIAKAEDAVQKQIDQMDIIIDKQGDVKEVLGGQKDVLREQLSTYVQIKEENRDLVKLVAEREESEKAILQIMEDSYNKMSELFTSTIRKMMDFGKFSFKDLFLDVVSMAKDMFANILNLQVFQPLKDSIMGSMASLFDGKRPVGSSSTAIDNALSGATGSFKDIKFDFPPIKLDINGGQTTTASGDTVNLNVNSDGQENGGDDIVVTANKQRPMGFFPGMMQGYKQSWSDTFKDLGKLFKPVGDLMKKAGEKLGISAETMGKVGEKVGGAMAGAQKGMMIAELGSMLGIKTSKTGGAIGGAIGSFLPIPGGDIIGAAIGSIVGGMFKKNKGASATIGTDEYGGIGVGDPTGRGAEQKQAASAMGNSIKSALSSIASSLGGRIADNLKSVVSIGVNKKGRFVVDEMGLGRLKSGDSKTPTFKSEEEAMAHAIRIALKKGIITGLSATSDRLLRASKDIDRAVQIVQVLESIKKQASAIRNPVKAMFEDLKRDLEDTLRMFKEANASAEDYADLALVAQNKFKDLVTVSLKELQDFRFDLTGGNLSYLTPADRLTAASGKFMEMESDIASGKAVDPSVFTAEASNLISLARDVYGSTPEFAMYQERVLKATDAIIASTQAQIDAYQPMIDAILGGTTQAHTDAEITHAWLGAIQATVATGNQSYSSTVVASRGVRGPSFRVSNF